MTNLRPDYHTIRGGVYAQPKSALAAKDGTCPIGGEQVSKNEPVYLIGIALFEGKVDLSSAEWVCGGCLNG